MWQVKNITFRSGPYLPFIIISGNAHRTRPRCLPETGDYWSLLARLTEPYSSCSGSGLTQTEPSITAPTSLRHRHLHSANAIFLSPKSIFWRIIALFIHNVCVSLKRGWVKFSLRNKCVLINLEAQGAVCTFVAKTGIAIRGWNPPLHIQLEYLLYKGTMGQHYKLLDFKELAILNSSLLPAISISQRHLLDGSLICFWILSPSPRIWEQ